MKSANKAKTRSRHVAPLPLTERRRHLQSILPQGSAIISEALSVTGRGHNAHDLEGVVAKGLKDGYGSRVRWLKIKNPGFRRMKAGANCLTSEESCARPKRHGRRGDFWRGSGRVWAGRLAE